MSNPTTETPADLPAVAWAARSCLALGAVSACFGLFVIVGWGYLNPLRFGPWFIGVGLAVWFAPGLAMLFGGWYLRERQRWAVPMAAAGTFWQAAAALTLEIGQFWFEPLSPILVLVGGVWLAALVVQGAQLRRAWVALRADATARHGFEVRPIGGEKKVEFPKPAE